MVDKKLLPKPMQLRRGNVVLELYIFFSQLFLRERHAFMNVCCFDQVNLEKPDK